MAACLRASKGRLGSSTGTCHHPGVGASITRSSSAWPWKASSGAESRYASISSRNSGGPCIRPLVTALITTASSPRQVFARGVHTFDDLKHCPFLEKKDLLEQRDALVASDVPASQRLYITTGGSTGVPVGFYLQKGVSRPKEQAFWETIWRRAGYFDGARLALIRGHVVGSTAAGKIASYDATRDWLMLSSYHLTEARLPEYLAAIEQFKPDLLHAYPSAALQLAEYLEKSGKPGGRRCAAFFAVRNV
ncbi:MAG: hypothetical protein U1G07_14745 [Verrucomicrobiota bacterium]